MNTLPKGLAAVGRSDCTSAKRNGDRSLSSPSESAHLRYFLLGAMFMQLTNVLLNLWLDAGVL